MRKFDTALEDLAQVVKGWSGMNEKLQVQVLVWAKKETKILFTNREKKVPRKFDTIHKIIKPIRLKMHMVYIYTPASSIQ